METPGINAVYDNTEKKEKIIVSEDNKVIISDFIELCSESINNKFIEQRKYNIDIIKELKIGSCDEKVFMELKEKYSEEKLKEVGFIHSTGFKPLNNRIIFPYGLEYFSARTTDIKKNKKFKNLFPKKEFFGGKRPYFIKGDNDKLIICEGETDSIALKHIFPKYNIIGSGGVNSANNIIDKINKEYSEIIICFDNDNAGEVYKKKLLKKLIKFNSKLSELIFDQNFKDIDDIWREFTTDSINQIEIKSIDRTEIKENKELVTKISFIEDGEILVEQVFIDGKAMYCVYDTSNNSYELKKNYVKDGVTYTPFYCQEVIEKKIKLPTKPIEYGSVQKLQEEINNFIYKWLDIPKDTMKYAVYNIMKSWVYDRFHTINYLRALGDPGTGKSRYLDVLGYLHYKPVDTSGVITPAVLFRLIQKWKGTLMIDECDIKDGDESNEVIKIINQGYEKGKSVIRCNKDKNNDLDFFDTYCPKILTTRREFQDKATESRCMSHTMITTRRKDIQLNLDDSFFYELEQLRNKLLMYRFKKYYNIDLKAGNIIQDWDLEPRLKQVNKGFLCMFADDEKEVLAFKTWLYSYQEELTEQRKDTIEGRIIQSILNLKQNNKNITSKNIIEEADFKNKDGNYWKSQSLNKFMKTLGFPKSEKKRIGELTHRIFEFDNEFFDGLKQKYGCSNVPTVPVVPNQAKQKKIIENLNNNVKISKMTGLGTTGTVGTLEHNNKLLNGLKMLEQLKKPPIAYEIIKSRLGDKFKNFEEELEKLVTTGSVIESKAGYYQVI